MKNLVCACVLSIFVSAPLMASPVFYASGDFTHGGLAVIDPDTAAMTVINQDGSRSLRDIDRLDDGRIVAANNGQIVIYNENGVITNSYADTQIPIAVTAFQNTVYFISQTNTPTYYANLKKLDLSTGTITQLSSLGTLGTTADLDLAVRAENNILINQRGYQIRLYNGSAVSNLVGSNLYGDISEMAVGKNNYVFFSAFNKIYVIAPDNSISLAFEVDIYAGPYLALQGISYDPVDDLLYGFGFYMPDAYTMRYDILEFAFDENARTLSMNAFGINVDDQLASMIDEFVVINSFPIQMIPEPCTILLLASALAWFLKRRKNII